MNHTRRQWLAGISMASASALLVGCNARSGASNDNDNENDKKEDVASKAGGSDNSNEGGPTVTATEDLMREHGILRRALLVYQESAIKLRKNPSSVAPAALEKTAQLFRAFGEEYHEKKLEEAFIFPAVKKTSGPSAIYADVLSAQHVRGREITDYILSTTAGDKIASAGLPAFIGALESFVRMYEHHAAIEDTIVFPAWKATMDEQQFDEMGEKFEEIEQQQFGTDGFDAAVKRMGEIEESLGLANLGLFTAPPPPARG